ncbi:MAG: hypothetical protein H5T86_02850 [Armatimonadetes bacterium]|nr:hypothetical protein [Armatimonadota bacterium]
MRSCASKGFSSLEWGMVALIIAAAVAFIARVGRLASENAKSAACLSNLKQLAEAAQLYMADFDGLGPKRAEHLIGLYQYIRNTQIFLCPAAASHDAVQGDYCFALGLSSDDAASSHVAWDDRPDRHIAGAWQAACLDGRALILPPSVWAQVERKAWGKPVDLRRPPRDWEPRPQAPAGPAMPPQSHPEALQQPGPAFQLHRAMPPPHARPPVRR